MKSLPIVVTLLDVRWMRGAQTWDREYLEAGQGHRDSSVLLQA